MEESAHGAPASVVYLHFRDPARSAAPLLQWAQHLADGDRIILESPAAAAIALVDNPKGALSLANAALLASAAAPASIGLANELSAARDIAEFAAPGRILASRAFRDHLFHLAPEEGRYLAPAGTFRDREAHSHELYAADAPVIAQGRRRFLVLGAAGAGGLLALGWLGRFALHKLRPAAIELDIKPEGDILVDGVFKGTSPPLVLLQLAPGKHTIEIRNARYKTHSVEVEVKAGEQMSLRHSFTAAAGSRSAIRRFLDRFK
jgi:hypothetical protein